MTAKTWEEYFDEGAGYLVNVIKSRNKLGVEVLYQSALMGMERIFYALLSRKEILPAGHDLPGLLEETKALYNIAGDIERVVLGLAALENTHTGEVCGEKNFGEIQWGAVKFLDYMNQIR